MGVGNARTEVDVGDLSVLDPDTNPALLQMLNPAVMMVGLNISQLVDAEPFRNFHAQNPRAMDFQLRAAFTSTPYYGAYMTDVVKATILRIWIRKWILCGTKCATSVARNRLS